MKQSKSDKFLWVRQVGILSAIPIILVSGPIIGYFVGDWLDNRFGWDPYGKVLSMVLGFVAAAYEVVRVIRQALK